MYKYQSKCKFRMLTTIGEKIIEIRPKQIIEANQEIKNPYLRLVKEKNNDSPKRGRPKVVKDEKQHTECSPSDSQTDT
jgi:hypothetical protein